MSKRKCPGTELRVNKAPSPKASKSSSAEWTELSSSSSSSSVSYSSKMMTKDTCHVLSPEAEENYEQHETKAMTLVGCSRCFMYVMLSKVDPKCPKCKSTVFLELFKDEN